MDELKAFLIDRKELFERSIERAIKSKNEIEYARCCGARSEIDIALSRIKMLEEGKPL